MFKLHKLESVKQYFCDFGILTVYGLYIMETIIYVKEHQNPLVPNRHHQHDTRISRGVKQHKLKIFEKKTNFIGSRFLFRLPKELLLEQNLKKFKLKLKNYLLQLSLYSFEEFLSL